MIDRLGHALATWLLPINVSTAVLLALVLLVDRALSRRARASLRVALYAPIAVRVLLPLSWSLPLAHVSRAALLMPFQVLSATAPPIAAPIHRWHGVLAVAYLAVAAALALLAVVRRVRLARALASARPMPSTDAPCPVLGHLELGPMVVGLFAPRIVLPQALLDGGNTEALACIARHEAAHVRRHDAWLAAAMELMLIVAWPVSPLWIAAARVRHLMELACDEAVLAGADAAERRRYGHLLLDVAEQRSLAFAGAGSLHFGSTLRARIEAIALQCLWPRAVQTATITLAVAGFAACSSAGPTTAQTTGSTQSAATAGADDYGYQYEADPVASASQPASPPTRDANHPGRIPPEIIQSVVRGNFGSFRSCYEKALKTNPKLEGIARIQFTITLNGSVQDAAGDGSTLPDDVVQCVVYGFSHLTFPPPKDGFVTVIYPIEFRPD